MSDKCPSDIMKENNYSFMEFSSNHKEAVIRLLEHLWKRTETERSELFHWKYGQNPIIEKPYAFVALNEGEVVGFRGFFPAKYRFGKREVLTLSPSDTIVDPNHRRKGLFSSMTKYAMEVIAEERKIHFYLNLSSNKYSSPGYLKMGWESIVPEYKIFSRTLTGMMMGKISGSGIYRKSKMFFDLADELLYAISSEKPLAGGRFEITRGLQSEAIAELSTRFETNRLYHAVDAPYIEWRFRKPFNKYLMSYLWKSDGGLGAFCMFIDKGNGHFMLADHLHEEARHLQSLLSGFLRKTRANCVSTWSFAKDGQTLEAMKKAGFYSPKFLYVINPKYIPLPFLLRPVDLEMGKESWVIDGRDIRDVDTWHINPINSDGN